MVGKRSMKHDARTRLEELEPKLHENGRLEELDQLVDLHQKAHRNLHLGKLEHKHRGPLIRLWKHGA